MGTLDGKFIRQSLDTSSLEKAAIAIQELELGKREKVFLEEACKRHIAQGEANGLSHDTLNKHRLIHREMKDYFGKVEVRAITPNDVAKFRETWKVSNVTARKKIERLRSFFRFCMDREWIKKNPAKTLKLPKELSIERKPFEPAELEKIEWAIPLYSAKGIYGEGNRDRLKAFVAVLRWTGLRVRDVVQLKRSQVVGDRIILRTHKNRQPVQVVMHEEVKAGLESMKGSGEYFFWSGEGNAKSCVGDYQRSLRKLSELSGVHIHAHRFRHTFASQLLMKGVPVSEVAAILGNSPRIVEKHYSQWIQARQDALDVAVKATWA